MMPCSSSRALLASAVLAAGALAAACDTGSDRGASLYDPSASSSRRPDPVVTAVAAQSGQVLIDGKAVAGYTPLVITGTGFVKDSTFVYFNGQRVAIESFSPTQLVVKSPNLVADNVQVRVSVLGAANFSAPKLVSFATPFARWGAFGPTNAGFGVAPDFGTNIAYVSASEGGASQGIQQVSGASRTTSVATGNFTWPELAYLNSYVYGVRGVRAVLRFRVPGGTQETWAAASTDAGVQLNALDVEGDGGMWTGGNHATAASTNRFLYYISPAKAVTAHPHGGIITAVEATPTAVYVAGTVGNEAGVWKYARTGTTLAAPVLHASVPGVIVSAVAAVEGGELLLGVSPTDATQNASFADPLRRVSASGQVSVHMPGLLSKGIVAMRWLAPRKLLVTGAAIVGNADSQKPVAGDLLLVDPLLTAAP